MSDTSAFHDVDLELWNSYVNWAWAEGVRLFGLPEGRPKGWKPDCSKSRNRLPRKHERALRLVVFSAFILEYRLKSILLEAKKVNDCELLSGKVDLDSLLRQGEKGFWGRLGVNGVEDRDWDRTTLKKLRHLRNRISHGNRKSILKELEKPDFLPEIRRMYDAVVKAIGVASEKGGPTCYSKRKCKELLLGS